MKFRPFQKLVPALARTHSVEPIPVVHMIDQIWCDRYGVFVRGWIHAHAHRVREVALGSGEMRVATQTFHRRADLLTHYPGYAHVADTGFELYLACPPFEPVWIEAVTGAGAGRVKVTVPAHLQAEAEPDWLETDHPWSRFVTAMRERGGRVLEVGSRRDVGPMTGGVGRDPFGPACSLLGCDIHPGPGVDFVVDVHALSRGVELASFDGVFSVAVLEHLVAPWVAAAEINRVLRVGGLTMHMTVQAWPIHEQPNDFWRMSDRGLDILFGPAAGFEVVESGMRGPVSVHPSPAMRRVGWLDMPTCRGFAESYILARKVADVSEGAVAWPMSGEDLDAHSRAYPTVA
ncbi:MAG: methyltransferase domain-containing protein [Rhodopila sp.]|jgi:SAM-dependent methyltransferase